MLNIFKKKKTMSDVDIHPSLKVKPSQKAINDYFKQEREGREQHLILQQEIGEGLALSREYNKEVATRAVIGFNLKQNIELLKSLGLSEVDKVDDKRLLEIAANARIMENFKNEI